MINLSEFISRHSEYKFKISNYLLTKIIRNTFLKFTLVIIMQVKKLFFKNVKGCLHKSYCTDLQQQKIEPYTKSLTVSVSGFSVRGSAGRAEGGGGNDPPQPSCLAVSYRAKNSLRIFVWVSFFRIKELVHYFYSILTY